MGLADHRIPAEKLPQCWTDDVRMNALFAPFRLKSSNPESWEMKMKFWSDMLKLWCHHKKDPVVSAADAKVAFQRMGRTPACLEIVFEECFRNGELAPISKYQQILHSGPEGWIRWGARLAFKPAALAITAVTFLMPGKHAVDNDGLPKASVDATQRFVLESAVEEQATALLEGFPAEASRVGTAEELMEGCDWQRGRETFEILLAALLARGCAGKKGDIIKLADSPSSKAAPITDCDLALARLLSAERRLLRDALKLSRDADRAGADAAAALATGNRLGAKNHLRRKHKLLDRAQKCDGALENVRQLLQSMRDTETNVAVVDTYRISKDAMKRNMQEGGVDEESVHDTMDELREVLESYGEVEKALARPNDDLDAAELEAELQALLNSPGPTGGTPGRGERRHTPASSPTRPIPATLPTPPSGAPRKLSERDFVFDGEAQMLHELSELGLGDNSPRDGRDGLRDGKDSLRDGKDSPRKEKPVAVADGWGDAGKSKGTPTKPNQRWYPRHSDFATPALDQLCDTFSELRTDQRLHPGQKLNVDLSTPPTMYNSDFQVQDQSLTDGVWLFNRSDRTERSDCVDRSDRVERSDRVDQSDRADRSDKKGEFTSSTEYFSSESPGKSGRSAFQMAPGGERPHSSPWQPAEDATEDLQRRLDNLRGFNL